MKDHEERSPPKMEFAVTSVTERTAVVACDVTVVSDFLVFVIIKRFLTTRTAVGELKLVFLLCGEMHWLPHEFRVLEVLLFYKSLKI